MRLQQETIVKNKARSGKIRQEYCGCMYVIKSGSAPTLCKKCGGKQKHSGWTQ